MGRTRGGAVEVRRFPRGVAGLAALAIMIGCLPLVFVRSAQAACTPYEFVGARGSGQIPQPGDDPGDYSSAFQYGLGNTLFAEYAQLTKLAGDGQVGVYGVHYPAVSLAGSVGNYLNAAGAFLHIAPLGAYTASVTSGTSDAIAHIEQVHSTCPETRFLLAGYSQGAQAVGDALQRMPQADRDLVLGATFFGDPYFNVTSWSARAGNPSHYGLLGVRDEWPEQLHGDIWSYCHSHDPICGISKRYHILGDGDVYVRDFPWYQGFGPHENYATGDNPDTDDAARQLARLLGAPTPVSGNVPLDLAFAIDTTGSMGPYIADVQSNVNALAQSIAATSTSYRFALIDYKDGPQQGDPYKAQVDLPFSTDTSALSTAVNGLSASGGGDIPESVYSGVMTALNLPWRNGVRKIVIPIGDAPGKDPEDDTGYTLDTVRTKALSVDPAQVYPVALTSDSDTQSFMQALADATGGKLSVAPTQDTFVSTLQSAIVAAGSSPIADAGESYTGVVNDPVTLSAGNSRDEAEKITAYDWDFDGNGTYDQTTTDPVVTHTWDTTGEHTVVLRTRTASGLAATATATVSITAAPAPPAAVTHLQGAAGDGTATLTWQADTSAGPPQWFTITDGSGHLLDRVPAGADGSAPPAGWIDQNLANGSTYTYRVSAGNVAGESAVQTVTVIPHGSGHAPTAAGDSYATDQGVELAVPAPGVLINDSDSDAGDSLTAVATTQPGHGTLTLNADGSFTYIPDARFVGTDSFTYKAVDKAGLVSAPATVQIVVKGISSGGRFILVAQGHPPLVTYGALDQSLNITLSHGVVIAVTGQSSYRDRDGNKRTISVSIHRKGRIYTATISYGDGTSIIRTYSGAGFVRRLRDGHIIAGFAGRTGSFGFGYIPPEK